MWLADYITRNAFSKNEPTMGDVTSGENGTASVDAELEHRGVPIVAPFGIAYNPPKNIKSVVLPTGGTTTCIGVVMDDNALKEGEVMLYSSGGASIVLKNDGTVVINGKVFE